MAAFEPFFFYTEGQGVIYLAFKLAEREPYSVNDEYMSIGSFQNINPLKDGKMIYHVESRYSDKMNQTSVFGQTPVSETMKYTKANMIKFIKSQGIKGINPNQVKLFSKDDFYWFVPNEYAPVSRKSRPRTVSVKQSANGPKRSASRGKKKARASSRSRSRSRSRSNNGSPNK